MKLIAGLGNPGEKYEKTRHNLGFVVLDALLQKLEPVEKTSWKKDKKFNSQLFIINPQLLLAKPQTMMNSSGQAVQKIARFYRIKPEDIWIVYDDVDILLGRIKIRQGGAAAGHHGVESIIEHLGTDDFVRFRLGIGKAGRGAEGNVEVYVLREFGVNEAGEVKQMVKKAVQAIGIALGKGLEKAMNQFNQ